MKKAMNIKKLTITAVVAFIAVVMFFGGGRLMADSPEGTPALEIVMEVQEAHTPFLMEDPDVVGTAVGLTEDDVPVIKVFSKSGIHRRIPNNIEGIPVEVEVTGMFVARRDIQAWETRPVPIGVSTGHPDITAGTIGCRVKDASGYVYALSNNHIYADTNEALIGDSTLQPGPYDGGSDDPHYKIGELAAFKPIDFSGGDNTIDAAITLSSVGELGNATLPGGYGTPSSTTVSAAALVVGQEVQKNGRTTGWTSGDVYATNATVDVCYECAGPFCFGCKKLARFVDQIVITPGSFSAGGDSGSLIVTYDNNKNPVGLLFAGSSSYTIANPIDPVLDHFAVTVDDGTANEVAGGCEFDADCDDGDACTTDSCAPATGSCSHDGIICDDADACTTDSCVPATGCVFVDNGTCSCFSAGNGCADDADCCSNKCRGKPGNKTCK